VKSPNVQKIALFGGTFDPVHEGHLSIAAQAQESLQLEQVFFIPCRQSPLKESRTLASGEQRVEMLKLATSQYHWARVEDWELSQERPNYSWKTVEYFRERFPEAEIFWLMGEDQWEAIDAWNRSNYFQSLVKIVVLGRGDFELAAGVSEEVISLEGEHTASATQIRESLATGQTPPAGWLPSDVSDFIIKNHIYGGE